jgi:hypothetical protein
MSYFSCLLIGQPGAGKSTAAATAPGPVLFLDIDNKLHKMFNMQDKLKSGEVIQWPLEEHLTETTMSRLANMSKDEVKPGGSMVVPRPKGYIKLAEMIDKLVDSKCVIEVKGKQVKIETIVLDSYTSMAEHLKRLLMAVNQTSTMTLPLYGTQLSNFETLNNTLLSLPANVIFIAHQKADKDELTGEISFKPLIEGQMAEKIGKDFEEVYFMEKRVQGDGAKYEMMTVGSSMKPCRTSRLLPSRVQPNFKEIYK